MSRDFRASKRGGRRLVLFVLVFAAAVTTGVVLVGRYASFDRTVELDADLCPPDGAQLRGRAVFLVDLRKPVADTGRPGELLREVAREIGRDTELVVYTLAGSADAARYRVGRLCKPYAQADLQVEGAKDQRDGVRDCDDLPAQLPVDIRDSARRFCERRDLLGRRLDGLAVRSPPVPVEDAYLVEAFEDIKLEFADYPNERVLYVFSDMMQHADWYSHLDLGWNDWRFATFMEALEARRWVRSPPDAQAGLRVEVFYTPRAGRTDQPRIKARHQDLWRRYFDGAAVAYRELPPTPPYVAKRLTASDDRDDALSAAAAQLEAEQTEMAHREAEVERDEAAVAAAKRALERELRELERARNSLAVAPPPEAPTRTATPEASLPASPPPPDLAPPPAPDPAPASEPLPPCEVSPAGANPAPGYPARFGRWDGRDTTRRRPRNLGDATITVLYGITPAGGTTDVVVLTDRSHATRDRYRSLFEAAAIDAVRGWTFAYDTAAAATCNQDVMRASTFEFKYAAGR